MTASGNHNIPTPFTDYSAWLMVLDERLTLKFPPVEFPGFGGALQVRSAQVTGKTPLLAVAYNYKGAEKQTREAGIHIFNNRGDELSFLSFSTLKLDGHAWLETINNSSHPILLLSGDLIALSENLEVKSRLRNPIGRLDSYFLIDFDSDGIEEIFLNDYASQRTAVVNNDLQLLATIPLQLSGDNVQSAQITSGNGGDKVFIRSGTNGYFLEFTKNQYYLASFLIYPGVYLAFVLFIGVIRKVNTKQVERRESQKRRLLTLQLQSVKSQLDPHFTFNALNSVASLLYLEDRKTAYDALNKFTRLLRQMLNDADKVYRTLEEELQFVTGYLELEKVRFGNKFNYEITIGEGVTRKELVPKMALQTFAENAVKHGLVPKGGGGMLRIDIDREKHIVKIVIEDNGIGRKQAALNNVSLGMGLKMTRQFFEILNLANPGTVNFTIEDLSKTVSSGTVVNISISLSENNILQKRI